MAGGGEGRWNWLTVLRRSYVRTGTSTTPVRAGFGAVSGFWRSDIGALVGLREVDASLRVEGLSKVDVFRLFRDGASCSRLDLL